MELLWCSETNTFEKKSFVCSYVFHCFLSFLEMMFYTFFHAPFFFVAPTKKKNRPKKMKSMMASPALGLESWCIVVSTKLMYSKVWWNFGFYTSILWRVLFESPTDGVLAPVFIIHSPSSLVDNHYFQFLLSFVLLLWEAIICFWVCRCFIPGQALMIDDRFFSTCKWATICFLLYPPYQKPKLSRWRARNPHGVQYHWLAAIHVSFNCRLEYVFQYDPSHD